MSDDLKFEFITTTPLGDHQDRTWTCVGNEFALHIRITDTKREDCVFGRYYGGLEIHYRAPPDYMRDAEPSHKECWLLKAPCWHDGSSLCASETIIPFWLLEPENNERMFGFLRGEYKRRKASS